MPKCPKCGSELMFQDDNFQCPNCGSKFKAQKKPQEQVGEDNNDASQTCEEITDKDKVRELEARLAELEAEKEARGKQEKKQLEERIAVLEAEKYKREHRFDKIKAIGSSKAIVFAKTHWISLLISVLLLVAFITLMVTLVGLRGIYVNVNDSDDYIDFTATSYRTSVVDPLTGKTRIEEGKWKIDGDRLILTVKDELFGTIDADFDFQQIDGYKRISIDGKEYKRVSLVGLKTTQKKVKITFDPQNGQKPIVYKVKIGNKFNQDPPEDLKNGLLPFGGWYTQPNGQGDRYDLGNSRVWEDHTFYAYWEDEEFLQYFNFDNDGVLTGIKDDISQLPSEIEIPNGVTSIGEGAFQNAGLTEIAIPDSVTSIGNYAFAYCTGLQTVTMGKGVQSIGEGAFQNAGLTEITIPDTVTSIGSMAFSGTGLTSITIPDSVQSVGFSAFFGCTGLQTADIYAQNIGVGVFGYCTGLQTVTIGENVTSIGEKAFYNCTGLKSLTVSTKNSVYESHDGVLYKKNDKSICFVSQAIEGAVTILDGCTSISQQAFASCKGLTEITIPNSVTSIGERAFDGCTGLKTFNVVEENKVFQSKDGVLYKKEDKSIYLVPKSIEGAATILDGCTTIVDSAFSGCKGLTEITIPNSITSIGERAFDGCTGLKEFNVVEENKVFQSKDGVLYRKEYKSIYLVPKAIEGAVTILDGCTRIGENAFEDCTGLTKITIPDSVISVGDYAFYNCTGLETASINAQSIGEYAFSGCTELQTVTIEDSVTSIGKGAFYNCTGLQTVTIGDIVTSIGYGAFSGTAWYNAQPDGVVYIGKVLYEYKGKMPENTTINIKDSTVSISTGAFRNCTGLTEITIPDSVTSIGNGAFDGCTGIKTATIPVLAINHIPKDSLISVTIIKGDIGEWAFKNCADLRTVTIGEGVTSIGEWAFYNCTGLKDIYYAGDATQWANIEKGEGWNQYYENGYYTINYQLHFNSTGPRATSAEIAEENASGSATFEEKCAPIVWVKKQRLCA